MSLFSKIFAPPKRDESWQVPYVQAICIQMARIVPSDWLSCALVLAPSEKGIGNGLAHSAITPTPCRDFHLHDVNFVSPDENVLNATRALELKIARRRLTFDRLIIWARRENDGIAVGSEWEYDD